VSTVAVACAAPPEAGRSRDNTRAPRSTDRAANSTPIRIAAAGDIACAADPYGSADRSRCQYDQTSNLFVGKGFTRVLTLGDNQYDRGAYRAYKRFYGRGWGRAKSITSPVPGNHEYDQDPTSRPRGYFRYFGRRVKGRDGLGFYSFDVPAGCTPGHGVCWHLVALSSELCFAPGGCGPAADPSSPGPGNRMYRWLRRDLRRHPESEYPCTLAFWHHPLFSISSASGASPAVRPLWRLLYRARADVVLNGHSHNYQRWRPMAPNGSRRPRRGIREFIVGTGGASHYALAGTSRNVAASQARSFGVLSMTLRRRGYGWRWLTARGQHRFEDAHPKTVRCV
jgi:hypothetical protein